MATYYRGQPVSHAAHDRKTDSYALIGVDGECLAEMKSREFLSLPNRKSMEVRSGGYRQSGSKDQRGAHGKSGKAGRKASFSGTDPGADQDASVIFFGWPFTEEKKPKSPLKREGIVLGEIVGFRCWRIENGWLTSVYQEDVWLPGRVLEGRGLEDWDERGIHAWKSADSKDYREYIRSYLNNVDPFGWVSFTFLHGSGHVTSRVREKQPAMVTGTVFLWGDVVEHERGYRAEFARVRSLDWLYPDETMMGREQAVLEGLRKLYGV